jgi:Fe-S-cluster containining protein
MTQLRSFAVLGDGTATSPCDACISGCCRGFNLVIEGFDAYRVARDVKLPLGDFVELRWSEKQEGDHRVILDATVPVTERRYHRLLLIRVPEPGNAEYPQRCIFLVTVGTRGRCGIYFSRPSMCRTYPSQINDGVVSTNGGKFCPKGAWNSEMLDLGLFRARQLFRMRQRAIYDRIIDAWNGRVLAMHSKRAPSEYAQYLMNVYRGLEQQRPEWFVETQPGDPEQLTPDEIQAALDPVLAELGWVSAPRPAEPEAPVEPALEPPPPSPPAEPPPPVAVAAAAAE